MNKDFLDIILESIKILPGILWPIIALIIFIVLKKDIKELLHRIKKGTILGNDFELTSQINELYNNVEDIKNEAPVITKPEKIELQTIQDDILKETEKDPKLGLISLAKKLEKECSNLMYQTGWHTLTKHIQIKNSFSYLSENGIIPTNTLSSVNLFLEVRNKIIHENEEVKTDEILRVIDIGLTLLKTIQSIPREINIVYKTNIELYLDKNLTQKSQKGQGIMLTTYSPGRSIKTYRIFPTTKTHFIEGQKVAWEWSFDNIWDECFYKDPVTNEVKSAWGSSAEFIGRTIEDLK